MGGEAINAAGTVEPVIGADVQRRFFRRLNSIVAPVVKAGLGSPLPIGVGAVVLEHSGRVSGTTYEVPLLAARVGNRVYTSTLRPGSQWLKNLEAETPSAVWLCGDRRETAARVQRGPLNVVELVARDA